MVYTFADGVSLNFRTSLGRVSFVPLFTDREHLRRAWVRIPGPVRSASTCRAHPRGYAWLSLKPAPAAQALAAVTRRKGWFAERQDARWWRRCAYKRDMEAAAHMAARDGAAQGPGVKGALLPAADAAVALGTRIGDGFLGLWDHALAMMPAGASPARNPQVLQRRTAHCFPAKCEVFQNSSTLCLEARPIHVQPSPCMSAWHARGCKEGLMQ